MDYPCSGGASDALIVVPTAKQEKDATQEQDAEEPQLSKSQLRKLKQVQLKKERRENLTQVNVLLRCTLADAAGRYRSRKQTRL